jgi:5-hydroxyisourate hydrolase-like protein (transthyretin family)
MFHEIVHVDVFILIDKLSQTIDIYQYKSLIRIYGYMGRSHITRNKRDNLLYPRKMHVSDFRYLAVATMMVLVVTMAIPFGYAQLAMTEDALVKITAKSWKTITVVKVENSKDNIYSVKLIWLTLQNGIIESYKAENGWSTEAGSSNQNAIQFRTDINMIKPGESARFGIKSDQSNPIFKWIVMDEEGDELGSGAIDVVKAMQEAAAKQEPVKPAGSDSTNTGQNNTSPTPTPTNGNDKPTPVPTKNPAIAVQTDIIRPGVYVRLLGEGFMPDSRITVLFDGKLIETLKTGSDGTIKDRIKIPDGAVNGAHQLSVSDSSGRAANLPITVENPEAAINFTVATEEAEYKQGDLVRIFGIAKASAAVSLRAVDPAGNSIFSSAVSADKDGKYTAFIPLGSAAVTGEYLVSALQDGKTITAKFKVLTERGYAMSILTDKFEYKQGESVIITGQASPNKDVDIKVLDPNGAEIFTTMVKTDNDGNFTSMMIVSATSPLGKYSVTAKVGDEQIALTFSVVKGSVTLTVQTDKNEYRDGELVRISGKGRPNDRVTITILTPKEDRIPMSANTKEDGTYSALWLIQKTAIPGNYKVIIQQGDSRAEVFFAVFS